MLNQHGCSTSPADLIDWPKLVSRLGDDVEFLQESLELFLEHSQSLTEQIGGALMHQNADELYRHSHELAGMALNMEAHPIADLAQQIQQHSLDNAMDAIEPLARKLEACNAQLPRLVPETVFSTD